MDTQFQDLIPKDFHDNSRVWIYQADRAFSKQELTELGKKIEKFGEVWHSHGSAVRSYANLLFDHFIILMADESQVKVGGCSTDSSFRFIKG
ncbi:MAG: hypothetical protein ABI136_04090, partial [Ginsengibacter sp.]